MHYCGLDGTAALGKWLHLSWDHLLPKGHPDCDDHRYIMAACGFCNEVHNRTRFDVEGKTPEQVVAMKKELSWPAGPTMRSSGKRKWHGTDHCPPFPTKPTSG